ncbi:MAG: HlyD family type I secretion periplasmic adaptor subunit [Colwellia sp.]|nr:HlyD family type I secretion periplasmic adaptor subunit [Colwellia sp.]
MFNLKNKLTNNSKNTADQYHSISEADLAYMHSLSAAVLEHQPKRIRRVLLFWLATVFLMLIWATFAEIDEIARGTGKIVPSGENQILQNFEGGIIDEVFVEKGDVVIAGQVLLKLSNQKTASLFEGQTIKNMELQAKLLRLNAQANGSEFIIPKDISPELAPLITREKSLYLTNIAQLKTQQQVFQQKLNQRKHELNEAKVHIKHFKAALLLIQEEVRITEPVVIKGVKSKVEFIKLQREENAIEERYQSAKISIPRLEAAISEAQNNLVALKLQSQSKLQQEINEVTAELERVIASSKALTDETQRSFIRSPSNGIIQSIFVHTIGGVVKPGANLIELVPSDDVLWVEVKLKPADIAFIYPGQKAIVKFTAYDFSIYGGLSGEVVKISADTQTDRQENTFYTVHIKTQQSFLGNSQDPLKIIPGMTTSVDIITGKKTVLDYILKPILRATYYTFSER